MPLIVSINLENFSCDSKKVWKFGKEFLINLCDWFSAGPSSSSSGPRLNSSLPPEVISQLLATGHIVRDDGKPMIIYSSASSAYCIYEVIQLLTTKLIFCLLPTNFRGIATFSHLWKRSKRQLLMAKVGKLKSSGFVLFLLGLLHCCNFLPPFGIFDTVNYRTIALTIAWKLSPKSTS